MTLETKARNERLAIPWGKKVDSQGVQTKSKWEMDVGFVWIRKDFLSRRHHGESWMGKQELGRALALGISQNLLKWKGRGKRRVSLVDNLLLMLIILPSWSHAHAKEYNGNYSEWVSDFLFHFLRSLSLAFAFYDQSSPVGEGGVFLCRRWEYIRKTGNKSQKRVFWRIRKAHAEETRDLMATSLPPCFSSIY